MTTYYVNTNKNRELNISIVKRLKELGYTFIGLNDYIDISYAYYLNPHCNITYSGVPDSLSPGSIKISIEDLFFTDKFKFVKPVIVELNSEYKAEVTKDGIKVGCQTFSFEKFDELAKAIEKYR